MLPIGGADMPVVIAILNSLTGLAAALTGLVLDNQALVIAGALVGASGSYLTLLMGKAMNRSVTNVLFGAFGGGPAPGAAGAEAGGEALPIRETNPDDAAVSLAYAERVIIVPGYGLAVAQAQHAVRELADVLEERGVDVKLRDPSGGGTDARSHECAAGRGERSLRRPLRDGADQRRLRATPMSRSSSARTTSPTRRRAMIPARRSTGCRSSTSIRRSSIIVLKRSMKSGFAGIENMLFHDPKTSMLFGDAKDSVSKLLTAVKAA